MANNIPASINYTNRDFYSLRDDLIVRVQNRVKENGKQWTATDPSDFGVALVEAFSYVGDLTNYYVDRVANEGFLGTAIQRQSLLDIAQLYGYSPVGYRQASVRLTFDNYNTSTSVTIPAGTQFIVDVVNGDTVTKLYYTLSNDVSVAQATSITTPSTATEVALHGYDVALLTANAANPSDATDISGELLGYSSGLTFEQFELSSTPVVESTISVYVYDGNNYIAWTKVPHLSDYGPTDAVYTTVTDSNDIVTVVFGDGISGAIPTLGAPIKASYVVGGGLVGNIEGGQTFAVSAVPVASGVTVSDLVSVKVYSTAINSATGGEDPESNDSLRANIPSAIRTLKRAVSLRDYQDLTASVSGVGKTLAKATQPTSVVVYVGPSVSDVSQDYYPGFNAANTTPTTDWYALQSSITAYLSDKTQVGVSVTVSPPTYIPVSTEIQYNKMSGYSHDQVINNIKYGLVYGYGYNFLDFNQVIYPEQIEADLMTTPGITSLKAINLYRTGGSTARTTLIPVNGEYFVFRDENTKVYPIASLKTLTLSSGTFGSAFQSHVFSYTITGGTTTTTTFTPTAWDATCVITVNGVTVASGATSGAISTPTGATTTVTIVVTTADGLSSNTYTLSIVR